MEGVYSMKNVVDVAASTMEQTNAHMVHIWKIGSIPRLQSADIGKPKPAALREKKTKRESLLADVGGMGARAGCNEGPGGWISSSSHSTMDHWHFIRIV